MIAKLLRFLRPYRKAIAGFVTPGIVALLWALTPGSDAGSAVTGAEWGTVLTAMVATTGVVWKVRNHPKTSSVAVVHADADAVTAAIRRHQRKRR